jgi:uncharacterized membrane protein
MRRALPTIVLASLAGAAFFVGSASLPGSGLLDRGQVGDTPLYHTYGEAMLDGRVPYRDFYVEYPPGALAVFVAPAVGDGDYTLRFKLLACLFGALCAALAALVAARRFAAAAFVGLSPALLGPVTIVNFDFWPALLATAALAALVLGRTRIGFLALGAAIAAKGYPLVLLPLAFLYVRSRTGARAAWTGSALCAGAVAAIMLPFFALAPGGLGNTLLITVRRPLQIESLGSALLLAAHQLGAYRPSVDSLYNSQNLAGPLADAVAVASSLAAAAALVAVWVAFGRGPASRDRFLVAAAAALAGLVAFGKVLSPQYLVWLVPAVALLVGRRALLTGGLLAAALVLTRAWFPSRYGELVALQGIAWVVLLRDLVLVALFFALVRELRHE